MGDDAVSTELLQASEHTARDGVGTPEWGHRPMTHQLGSVHGFLNLPRFPHLHNGDDYTVEGVGPL